MHNNLQAYLVTNSLLKKRNKTSCRMLTGCSFHTSTSFGQLTPTGLSIPLTALNQACISLSATQQLSKHWKLNTQLRVPYAPARVALRR